MVLSCISKGDSTMFPLSRNFLKRAAASILVVLTAAGTPILADEMAQEFGPVRPHEPILATVGSKRVIVFYVPGGGDCNLNAVVWNGDDPDAKTAIRIRLSLNPAQSASIDSAENKSLTLDCGDHAETLAGRLINSQP
jgi:hypothetical protein